MLAWSVVEFGKRMPAGQLDTARQAVRWVGAVITCSRPPSICPKPSMSRSHTLLHVTT